MQIFRKLFPFPHRRDIAAWLVILGLVIASAFYTYGWSKRDGYARLESISSHQLDLYAAGLESELGKHEYLPGILQQNDDVLALLASPETSALRDRVNKQLAGLNVRAGALAVFVLDTSGIVRASSNWYQEQNYVGKNFSNMPYFSEAMDGMPAHYFVTNPVRNSPEYYFAQPLRLHGKVVGVAAVKISLEPIESTWIESTAESPTEKLLVVDANNVIIISTAPEWKYKAAGAPTTNVPVLPARYASKGIEPLGIVNEHMLEHGARLVGLPALASTTQPGLYVAQERNMLRFGWRLIILHEASEVWRDARFAAFGAGTLAALLGLLGMYLLQHQRQLESRQRTRVELQRAHDELELRIAERTAELQESNLGLVREITERKRTEEVLREAQDELIQAGKLALLGQMAAGITHEINQPLTALRALSYNTRLLLQRGRTEDVERNLQSISDLTERIVRITAQLKSFARKAPLTNGPVLLAKAVDNTLVLLQNRIRSERVTLRIEIDSALTVFCDGNRLEQVLLNLFANALDAMKHAIDKTLSVEATNTNGRVRIRVCDTGSGIPESVEQHLFEPFFSTKSTGEGLGLGLVISSGIVSEFGGVLRTVPVAHGAAFEFELNLAEEPAHV